MFWLVGAWLPFGSVVVSKTIYVLIFFVEILNPNSVLSYLSICNQELLTSNVQQVSQRQRMQRALAANDEECRRRKIRVSTVESFDISLGSELFRTRKNWQYSKLDFNRLLSSKI